MGRALPRLLEQYQRAGENQLADELAYDKRWEEVGPMPARAHLALGNYFERVGDGREAMRHYQTIVEASPADPSAVRAFSRIGAILHKGGDLRGARRAYESARSHPACAEPWPGVIDKALAEIGARGA
jgi:Flp pilus assembly protein TadD